MNCCCIYKVIKTDDLMNNTRLRFCFFVDNFAIKTRRYRAPPTLIGENESIKCLELVWINLAS